MQKKNGFLRFCALFLAFLVVFLVFPVTKTSALYNDAEFESYINLQENSALPNLFRNDSIFSSYKKYPPVIYNGVEYVPLEIFYGLSGIKISFSEDSTNFYIQNKKTNNYISFSLDGGYAIARNDRTYETSVKTFYGVYYLPLRIVCAETNLGFDTYNDTRNKIYVIKIFTTPGISASDLIKIHAPGIYDSQNEGDSSDVLGRRTLYLSFVGGDIENVQAILYSLANTGIKGAFFVTARDIQNRPDIIRSIYTSGHSLGICFDESAEELCSGEKFEELTKEAEDLLYSVLRTKTRLICLPQGDTKLYNDCNIYERAKELGVSPRNFTIDARTDVLGAANAFASISEGIKNLEANRGTTIAHIKFASSPSCPQVVYNLFSYSRQYKGVYFAKLTEATQ